MSFLLDDLKRSGLTKTDAKLMQLLELDEAGTKRVTKKFDHPGYAIPYFEDSGKRNGFMRIRFTAPVELDDGRQIRYWQPPKSNPHVYFPPHINWREVLADPSRDIIVTEGEKKAAAGAKLLKKPVIGLGGVWSWGAKKQQLPVIPELIPYFKNRRIQICFDRDPIPNPDVIGATSQLAQTIRRNGGDAWLLTLPSLAPGQKVGLDDALVELGPERILALEPQPFGDVAVLTDLNKELAFITDAGAIYHIPTHALYNNVLRFTTIIYAHKKLIVYDAKGQPVEKNAAAEWFKWPQRREHTSLQYAPGQGDVLANGSLNVWPGWGVKPKRGGDMAPFFKLLDSFFTKGQQDFRKWFLQWLAYPLQRPGNKLYTSAILYSRHQGVGKSLMGETMGRIYGENFVAIDASSLHSPFNDWARHRQFVLADEVTGREKREDTTRLMNFITQEHVTINVKYQVPYTLKDCINYLLTTNHPDAVGLDLNDRRFFVWEIKEKTIDDAWFSKTYHDWKASEEGPAALFDYLLKLDLTGFDPRARAPITEAKKDMQSVSDTPVDFVIKELLEAPDRYLLGSLRDLYTASELSALLDSSQRYHPVAVAKALRRCGVRALPATLSNRGSVTLYAIRRQAQWLKATHAERKKHYDGDKS